MTDTVLVDRRYLLRERLGAGAFGVVHRAEQRALGVTLRQVALKLFDSSKLGVPVEELLHDALEMIAIVDGCPDPTVRDLFVFCYDAGLATEGEARAYVAMELVRGDLAAQIGGAQLPVRTALSYALQIARGIAFMHERGHLHRDLKPSNVLLNKDGRVKIGDFGLAVASESVLRTAPLAGTVVYQAPEALALQECTPASDVYSIGLICYEMLTGSLPYPRELLAGGDELDLGAMLRAKLAPIEPPSRSIIELRSYPEFEQVVLNALDTKGARYRDSGALLRALEAAAVERIEGPPWRETPRERILDLIEQAEALLRRDDTDSAVRLLGDARAENADLSDQAMVADLYPVLVKALVRDGQNDEAVDAAAEGLRRRRCRATYSASALAHQGTPLAASFTRLAREAAA